MMTRILLLLCAALVLTATSAPAAVYYQNDFESGSSGALSLDSKWQLLSSGGVGNSAAIRLTYDRAGTPGTQASLNLAPYNTQEFWLEFDTRIEGNMNGGMKFVKVFGSLSTPSQNNSTFIMDYSSNTLNRVLYYMDTICEVSLGGTNYNNSCDFTPVKTSSPIDLRGNQWRHVKIHFVRAAPGTSTGEYRIWVDGVEKVHFTNVNNNSPASSATDRIAAINFGDYTNSNSSTWYFWIDNLTVSSTDPGGNLPPPDPDPVGSGAFRWESGSYTVNEGAGSASFTITRSDASAAASVDWGTLQGTAAAGEDYLGVNWQTVNFAAGQSSRTVAVQVLDDVQQESSETFTLTLGQPVGGVLGTPANATVTVSDNDAAPPPPPADTGTIQWQSPSYVVTEGAGTVTFAIARSINSGAASVNWGTYQESAAVDQDYRGVAWQTVSFAPGESVKTVTTQIYDDDLAEEDETFLLALDSPAGAALSTPAEVRVTITDDDAVAPPPAAGTFQWSTPRYTFNEGAGTVSLLLTRTSGAGAASVEWATFQDTAEPGTDYHAVPWQVVQFADGETSRIVTLQLRDDLEIEDEEDLLIVLDAPVNGLLGFPNEASVRILDNDYRVIPPQLPEPPQPEPGSFAWERGTFRVEEGAGTIALTIRRRGGTDTPATVLWSTYQDSADRQDYRPVDRQAVHFAAGETSRTVILQINDDQTPEDEETVLLSLSEPSGAILGEPTDAAVTILDDDAPLALQPPLNLRRL